VHEHVEVAAVDRGDDGLFSVRTTNGDQWTAKQVVLASGWQNVPVVPDVASDVPDGVDSFHAAEYRSPQTLEPGAILVVGAGQSGVQIAEDLAEVVDRRGGSDGIAGSGVQLRRRLPAGGGRRASGSAPGSSRRLRNVSASGATPAPR